MLRTIDIGIDPNILLKIAFFISGFGRGWLTLRMAEQILILDFGSQYTQLIARRVRELDVYCEIHPYNKIPPLTSDIKGVILSGSPCSVRDEGAPDLDLDVFRGKLPILAVCYGAQLMAQKYGGNVAPSEIREYGRASLSHLDTHAHLFKEMTHGSQVWMSHGDTIKELPEGFDVIASTPSVRIAAYKIQGEETYGIQFHPEVTHSTEERIWLRKTLWCRSWTALSRIGPQM